MALYLTPFKTGNAKLVSTDAPQNCTGQYGNQRFGFVLNVEGYKSMTLHYDSKYNSGCTYSLDGGTTFKIVPFEGEWTDVWRYNFTHKIEFNGATEICFKFNFKGDTYCSGIRINSVDYE